MPRGDPTIGWLRRGSSWSNDWPCVIGVRSEAAVTVHEARARVSLAFAILGMVAACNSGQPVTLLTGNPGSGCFAANTTGLLIADARTGTTIVSEDMARTAVAVRWPAGYSGRTSGDQVEVLDQSGHVVARTGQRYELLGGYNPDGTWAACTDGVYPPLWPSPR
jgi:hypothetical protein